MMAIVWLLLLLMLLLSIIHDHNLVNLVFDYRMWIIDSDACQENWQGGGGGGVTPRRFHNNETQGTPSQGIDVTFNPKP